MADAARGDESSISSLGDEEEDEEDGDGEYSEYQDIYGGISYSVGFGSVLRI